MNISGLQKITLLDYPEHVACTVFLGGCNFRCPFCYNSSLLSVNESSAIITEEEFFTFLKSRIGKLDGVAITGGEPLLQKNLKSFIAKIKDLGFKVKLDTNGSFPENLKTLIDENLIDYVAMDIKNCFEKYHLTTNSNVNLDSIKKSIQILLSNKIDYEFRTTIVKEFHDLADFDKIGKIIKGAKRYFIQSYQDKDSVLEHLHSMSKEELLEGLKIVQQYVPNAKIRGV